MSNEQNEQNNFPWSEEELKTLSDIMVKASEQSQSLFTEYLSKIPTESPPSGMPDPFHLMKNYFSMTNEMMKHPEKLVSHQMALFEDYGRLWDHATKKQAGEDVEDIIDSSRDKRFKSKDWSENTTFDFIKNSYLLLSKHIYASLESLEGIDHHEKEKIDFFTKQMVDAFSPSNFIMTNPDVLKETMETKGENLMKGMQNMMHDLQEGQNSVPLISMVDKSQFEVGKNVAVTKGKVVFKNDLIELIQYAPTTNKIKKAPMVFFPPWINKYYILDLNEKKSIVQWLVNQGFTTFMVSWVNPTAEHRDKGLDNYLQEGYLEALKVVQEITGEKAIHTTGYCVGGTMLTAALAYLQATNQAEMIKSASLFTTLTNFDDAGELLTFIDEEQVAGIKSMMASQGYMDGKAMALTFNMLRSNDLIWSYLINNYLLGKEPMAFDLLYWNSDSTNQAEKCHSEYLENMYLHNKLKDPEGVTLCDVPLDLSQIDTPLYILATVDDHIAPAQSVYSLRNRVKSPARFVLGGSGHIAGVINPPLADNTGGKYWYMVNDAKADTLDDYMANTEKHEGSWWPDWLTWLNKRSKRQTEPRIPGEGPYPALEDAPGSYVKVKA
ncbi:class I poly(R)-hydroxyalkanoic acid synthase [Temperatibacter marinus]|uniref:Class I poly(R)-hydroxyalkanoic acid synthase n=1 Tax=Temperatibacter marinus TaxID=1456591 RepID=A0AA52H8X7_9PROT|nr:class I poly(R)-hydroxyalkanoic acid synthase [Temperatibacter marinus]WND01927.1 class I poly(R)-hydroxyalkanoic acid synthase [Temperatibacter marinus]